MTIAPDVLEGQLREYLREEAGDERPLQLGDRLSGGWSVDTFRVLLGDDVLVLRIADAGHPIKTSPAREARLFERVTRAGVPAPRMVCAEDDASFLGGPFSLSHFVEGTAPNVWSGHEMDRLLASASAEELVAELADLALRISKMPADDTFEPASELGMPAAGYDVTADVARWVELLDDSVRERPVLSLGGRWLAENAPETTRVAFQHHDFRLGNIMFGRDGTANAVLDWEFAGAGDPLCDIGYAAQPYTLGRLLHSRSRLDLAPDPTTRVLDEFAARAATTPDADRLRYFVAFGAFKMAVALVLSADEWWRGVGGTRDHWLELPILSLSEDLVTAIRRMP